MSKSGLSHQIRGPTTVKILKTALGDAVPYYPWVSDSDLTVMNF